MIEFESGGFEGTPNKSAKDAKANPVYIPEKDTGTKIQESHEESWPAFIMRNISKTPANLYAMTRGLGGIGDLIQQGLTDVSHQENPQAIGANQANAPIYEYLANYGKGQKEAFKYLIPPEEQSRKEAAYLPGLINPELGRYLTESRPSTAEKRAEFYSTAIPGVYNAGKQGIAELLRSLGSNVGAQLGGEAGGIPGAIAGATLGGQPERLINPSGTLKKGVETAERNAFETQKMQQLQEAQKQLKEAEYALPKAKTTLEKEKRQRIAKLDKSAEKFPKNIEKQEKIADKAYTQAQTLRQEKPMLGDASKLIPVLNETQAATEKGLTQADANDIKLHMGQLEKDIKDGKLSLDDAVTYHRTFNSNTFGRPKKGPYITAMRPVIKSLEKFINEEGSAAHTKEWLKGKNATIKKYDLMDKHEQLLKDIKEETREIRREKLSPEETTRMNLEKKEAAHLVKAIGKNTYEQVQKELKGDSWQRMLDMGDKIFSRSGYAALGTFASLLGLGHPTAALISGTATGLATIGKQAHYMRKVFKEHPEILKQFAKTIANRGAKDISKLAPRINKLGNEIEQYAQNYKEDIPEEKQGIEFEAGGYG
jgi:hypothetical protein